MLRESIALLAAALVAFASGCCFIPTASSCDERCAAEGACTVRTEHAGDGFWVCYAASDADCLRSAPCRDHGRCWATDDGVCVAQSEVASHACATSDACRSRGACRPRDGFCEAQTLEDCTASTNCLLQGRCTLDPPTGGCFVTPESCAASEECASRGLCGYERDPFGGRYGTCVPAPGVGPVAAAPASGPTPHSVPTPSPASPMLSDRLSRLRLHLACGGSRGITERQACFHEIVRLFNEWPPGPDRDAAFAETRTAFHIWSPLFREMNAGVGESPVYDEATRSVRDTMLLVSTLRVRRYGDDDRAPPLSTFLRSPHARDITTLYVTGTPLRLDELVSGPGARHLEALVLNDAITEDPPWEQLVDWPALATLQYLQIGPASASVSSERLWTLLEHAPVLASLHVRPRDFDAFMDRIDGHPSVAHRLDQLTLQHVGLSDRDLQRIIDAPALDHLVTLDLRQNPRITCDGLAALRRAPHLGRGTVIIDRDCP